MRIKKPFALLVLGIMTVLLFFSAVAEGELTDGYYLIRPNWTQDAIDPGEAFTQNPNNAAEYMLDTTLALGDSFKVVRVANNTVARWYPEGTGNEYQVIEGTPYGYVRIYFLPSPGNYWVREKYEIKVLSGIEGGSISASHDRAPEGETITLRCDSVDEGFELDRFIVRDNAGNSVEVADNHTFKMPDGPVTVSAAFKQHLDDGYYLIGTVASLGADGWTINAIKKNALFQYNGACTAGPEYILTGLTLQAGEKFKIVRVQGSSIAAWYPDGGDDTNYLVNEAHSGDRIIYFRPGGRADDYWSMIDPPTWDYFYVAPRNPDLKDGNYYLIGPQWAATDIDPEEVFFPNPAETDEFILLTDREQGSEVKVARIDLGQAITAWYPDGFYNQHFVSGEEAGDEVIYFRPAGNNGWSNYYFFFGSPRYITVEDAENGSVAVSTDSAQYIRSSVVYQDSDSSYRRNFTFGGAPLSVTATPDTGWELDVLTVADEENSDDEVEVSNGTFTMPAGNVRVTAVFRQTDYQAALTTEGDGSASLSRESGLHYGDTVTITANPGTGSALKEITVLTGTKPVNVIPSADEEGKYTFIMPAGDVDVNVIFTSTLYHVTVETEGNGTAYASSTSGFCGTVITLTATPSQGSVLREWQVLEGGVTVKGNRFTIGCADVRIKAVFESSATPEPYRYCFSFTKEWQGGREESIEWTLYNGAGEVIHKKFRKKIISDNLWYYEAWFPNDVSAYYLIENSIPSYEVLYKNEGKYAQAEDRAYNGGKIINLYIPPTGDQENPALWTGLAAVGLSGLMAIAIAGRRRRTVEK